VTAATAPTATATAPRSLGPWLAQTLRLAGWMLFQARRRVMSKVLGGILLAGFLLLTGGELLAYVAISNQSPARNGCPPAAVQTQEAGSNGGAGLTCPTPTPEQLAEIKQAQQQEVNSQVQGLTFPGSLGRVGTFTSFLGVLLLCILAGALVGGEYAAGTVRLAISRGVGRGQLVAAQALGLAALALIVAGAMLVLGALSGVVIGPALGGHIPGLPFGGWLELGAYWLALSLNIFIFELVAMFFATLGRSTAAGIGAALGYLVGESIVSTIFVAVSQGIPGGFGQFLGHIPEWMLGVNSGAVPVYVSQSPVDLGISTNSVLVKLTTGHALAVTLGYCVLLVGLSYALVRTRDITD
jgi:ABC-type transport system involved in multi-copper enzyme maturation permease subunit